MKIFKKTSFAGSISWSIGRDFSNSWLDYAWGTHWGACLLWTRGAFWSEDWSRPWPSFEDQNIKE